mgnify:FL=1
MNESKNVRKNVSMMFTGMVIGAALTGGSIAVAAGITAEPTWQPIFVDGQQVEMQAYNIAGHNYVKLRDMGEQVGFNVYWDAVNGCVQVESGKPYTGEAPAKAEPDKPDSQPEPTAPANDADVDAMKQDIVDRTNALRKENGIAALTTSDKLMQAAQVRADEMAAHAVYSHTRPNGEKFNTVTDCPYMAENIHRIADWTLSEQTISEAAVWSWNLSGGHRDNLLEKNYAETGVGLARGVNDNGDACWYCVQIFLWNGYSVSWVDTPAAK